MNILANVGDIITLKHPRADYSERYLVVALRTSRNGAIAYMVASVSKGSHFLSVPMNHHHIIGRSKADTSIPINAINRHIARLKHWKSVRANSKPAFSILHTRGYAHDGTYHATPDVEVIEGDDDEYKVACEKVKLYTEKQAILINKINKYLNDNENMKASA